MMAMVADKRFVHDLLDRILEFNLRVIENACAYDIDAMMFGDDWGSRAACRWAQSRGASSSSRASSRCTAWSSPRGKFVFIHSCGKVDGVFPDLIECGLDVFNPFQPEVIDVYAVKRTYGDRLSFFGGISTQQTLPYGTPAEVRDEVRRLLDEIGARRRLHRLPGARHPGGRQAGEHRGDDRGAAESIVKTRNLNEGRSMRWIYTAKWHW